MLKKCKNKIKRTNDFSIRKSESYIQEQNVLVIKKKCRKQGDITTGILGFIIKPRNRAEISEEMAATFNRSNKVNQIKANDETRD